LKLSKILKNNAMPMPCQKFESMKFSSTLVGTMLKMLLNIEVQMSLLFSHNQQIKKP